MLEAFLAGLSIFVLAYLGLMFIETIIHRVSRNPNRSYRWGVWLFSLLLGLYAFINYLGR